MTAKNLKSYKLHYTLIYTCNVQAKDEEDALQVGYSTPLDFWDRLRLSMVAVVEEDKNGKGESLAPAAAHSA